MSFSSDKTPCERCTYLTEEAMVGDASVPQLHRKHYEVCEEVVGMQPAVHEDCSADVWMAQGCMQAALEADELVVQAANISDSNIVP
jgi:hypothetical protein